MPLSLISNRAVESVYLTVSCLSLRFSELFRYRWGVRDFSWERTVPSGALRQDVPRAPTGLAPQPPMSASAIVARVVCRGAFLRICKHANDVMGEGGGEVATL